MFGWFSAESRLKKKIRAKLNDANDAMQKKGDRGLHAEIMAEVEELEKELKKLQSS